MLESFGGACIIWRTLSGRVSGILGETLVDLQGGTMRCVCSLVDVNGAAGSLNALLFGIDQSLDVAVHRVVDDGDLGSHDEGCFCVEIGWVGWGSSRKG